MHSSNAINILLQLANRVLQQPAASSVCVCAYRSHSPYTFNSAHYFLSTIIWHQHILFFFILINVCTYVHICIYVLRWLVPAIARTSKLMLFFWTPMQRMLCISDDDEVEDDDNANS